MKTTKTTCLITCPGCHNHAVEVMPEDACTQLYECRSCHRLLTPQKGDCCVFCSYGNNFCPTSLRERKAYSVMAAGVKS